MALDVSGNPFVFDGVGQAFTDKVKIRSVRCMTALASGEFQLKTSATGRYVCRVMALNANDSVDAGVEGWVDSLYVANLPTGGMIHVYIE